jgi:hypothetical protein
MSKEIDGKDVTFYHQLVKVDVGPADLKIKKTMLLAIATGTIVDFKPLQKWLNKEDAIIVSDFDDVYMFLWLVDDSVARELRGL